MTSILWPNCYLGRVSPLFIPQIGVILLPFFALTMWGLSTSLYLYSEKNIDLIDTLNKAMDEPDSKMMTPKYYELDKISLLLSSTSLNRSFFHLNISSLTFHFDELLVLMVEKKLNFDFLGISETRLKLNRNSLNPTSMPGYNIKHTPTESGNGGTLF